LVELVPTPAAVHVELLCAIKLTKKRGAEAKREWFRGLDLLAIKSVS
jgi:hypothetical protein